MTARWSGDWARPAEPSSPDVEVLIPAFGRPAELAVTLAGLAGQRSPDFSVILSDQTEDHPIWREASVAAMVRVLRAQGRRVRLERHLPRRGMAEQREFLLARASAPYVLFLDSDVWLEPDQLRRLHAALVESGCGFVGAAVQGLSYLDDDRPAERAAFEPWRGPVHPEKIRRGDPAFERWTLHNAANLAHVAAEHDVPEGHWVLYKIAWVGACVMFRRDALVECGGFRFWDELPDDHAGEDVLAEWRVMERWGGAGILPSGAVHLEAETTLPERSVDAFDVLLGSD
ncbi:glycosyltransferase [Aeromicrobium camelliae]|uniref:Glycosyltransferase n=1 Tax=Aeromicrobium camelliae TaxID=1538144 RepID=A0A3N6Z5F2_9ACTN|nr:glycosyltransferase family 2 protein [Aeromicrobium camelliae]RQN02147.1 glycosyltransferase [Aeromicrobium camelliae]